MNRSRLIVGGVIGVLALVVIGLGVTFVMVRGGNKPPAGKAVQIEVSDTACIPNALTVAAGTPGFAVKNASSRVMEWEILNGVMVVAERENIAPGFTAELTPRLQPGTYELTCGLLSNPHGTLTVTAADGGAEAAPAAPSLNDLIGPTAEYRFYAIKSADEMVAAATAMLSAVKSGDAAAARTQAATALAAFGHIAPVVHLFQRDANPLLTGPAALASLNATLASPTPAGNVAGLAQVAAQSATTLGGTVHTTTAAPHEIVAGAGAIVASLANGYDDAPTASAQIAGVRKVVDLFKPLTLRADKSLASKLDTDLGTVEAALAKSPAAEGGALKPQLTELGADLTALLAALGLATT